MADDIRTVRFNPAVYKNKTTNPGVLAKAGDIITVLLKGTAADGTHPQQPLTILTANDSGTEFTFEYDATNQYVLPNRIVGVIPLHTFECPAPDNYGITGTALTAVTSFQVGSKPVHTETYPITAAGAADMQADLNADLQGDGAASVVWVDAATDYFKVYIMDTTTPVKVNGTLVAALP